jgi:general secretion pathway protein I
VTNASDRRRARAPRATGYRLRATGQNACCKARRGFTLVEVLVALVVVSLGMLAVIQAVTQTAGNSAYMRDKTIAHWVAMNLVTQTRLQAQAPKIDKSSDEVEMAGRKWRWTMEVTQTPVDSVRRIDIKVRTLDAPEDSSLASVTGFYGQAIAPPGTTLINWLGDPRGRAGGPNEPTDGERPAVRPPVQPAPGGGREQPPDPQPNQEQ